MDRSTRYLSQPVSIVLLLLVVILLSAGGVYFAARWYLLPEHIDTLLLEAPENAVGPRMDQILSSSHDRKTDLLIRWMGSPRAAVALEATHRMQSLVDQMENLPGVAISAEATQLAYSLQNGLPTFSDPVRQSVRKMAIQMSQWKFGDTSAEHGSFLVMVEQIIHSTSDMQSSSDVAASDEALSRYLANSNRNRNGLASTPEIQEVVEVDLHSGLPWQAESLTSTPGESATSNASVIPKEQPLVANHRDSIQQPLKLPTLIDGSRRLESDTQIVMEAPDFSRLTSLEIMWKLHAQNPDTVEYARKALLSRNFSMEDLQLASRLTHPDVTQRLELVRELPLTQRDDRSTWLYYLTKDPDADVRYGAAAALLTSSDPRLLKRLKADLATDPSPRVQTLIQR
ncbi:hypothetical protein GC197_02785 [bacterium]|nr:hypothetical protein [bacterium]